MQFLTIHYDLSREINKEISADVGIIFPGIVKNVPGTGCDTATTVEKEGEWLENVRLDKWDGNTILEFCTWILILIYLVVDDVIHRFFKRGVQRECAK